MPELWDYEEVLERLAQEHDLDWAIKCDTAHECAWAVELRITRNPNSPTGPDRSLVFYSAGADSPLDGVMEVFAAAAADFPNFDWTVRPTNQERSS